MTAARALLATLGLLAVACASVKGEDSISTGGSGGAGGSSGVPACQVDINPVTPASFDGLVAGPGATLRVEGDVEGIPPASYSWHWQVSTADGTPVPTTAVGGAPWLVEFPISDPGSYTIAVSLPSSVTSCFGSHTVLVAQRGAKTALFRARFTPPPGAEPVQERTIQILGGTPSGGNVITLDAGLAFSADVRDAQGQPLAAYVRLTDPTQHLVVETHPTAAGPVPLHLAQGAYDLLVVPDGDLAPVLLPHQAPANLVAALAPLALPPGELVSGVVREGSTPVAGATVALRAGALPSTIATTGSDGAFTIHASPDQTYAATVTRPLALQMQVGQAGASMIGKLEATLPASAGVVVASGSGAAVSVDLAPIATAALSLSLGAAVTAGTSVVLESAPLPGVVTFRVGADARAADAIVHGEIAPASDGTLAVAGLPRAHYHGKVVPGAGMTAAITPIADLDLTTDAPPPQTVPLLPKVSISGNLVPSKQAGGVALTAMDTTGDLPSAIAGVTDPQGGFALAVSPGRTYALHVRPAVDRPLAEAVFGPLSVGATGVQIPNGQLPAALLYAGRVVDHSGVNGSPGTLIEIFCEALAPGCTDPNTPIAEAVTAANGAFALRLPDPGVN
jgi:hypothetical protein